MDNVRCDAQLNVLPCEIIESIFRLNSITHLELCRLSGTCQKLNCIASGNKLWKHKFTEKWPKLSKMYAVSNGNAESEVYWKQEFQARHMFTKKVKQKLSDMSEMLYSCESSIKYIYRDFLSLADGHKMALHFLIDVLECILFDGCSKSNLTEKYYGLRLLRFARQHHFSSMLITFLSQPENSQAPEIGAALISLYCQPSMVMTVEDVSEAIDDIAIAVKEEICKMYDKHPVLSIDLVPPTKHLEESLWTPADCRIILNCLNSVFFHHLRYKTLLGNSICDSSVYIDKVLTNKYGFATTISIIYMALAHRLGVCCFATNSEYIYIVKWLEHPDFERDVNRYTYINLKMKGKFVPASECFIDSHSSLFQARLRAKTSIEILVSMCKLLTETYRSYDTLEDELVVRSSALELYSLFEPTSIEHKLQVVQIYVQLKFKLHEASQILQQITSQDRFTGRTLAQYLAHVRSIIVDQTSDVPKEKISVKRRAVHFQVSYAVGMIMKHRMYNYVCVIYGWDAVCSADEIWIVRMGVRKLRYKDQQPFYNVLVDDGTCRYAAQENLVPYSYPKSISNCNVGKYFEEFLVTHYVPNKQMEKEYPEDSAAREGMLKIHAGTPFILDADPNFMNLS